MKDYKCVCGHVHTEHNVRKSKVYQYEIKYGVCMGTYPTYDGLEFCSCRTFRRCRE